MPSIGSWPSTETVSRCGGLESPHSTTKLIENSGNAAAEDLLATCERNKAVAGRFLTIGLMTLNLAQTDRCFNAGFVRRRRRHSQRPPNPFHPFGLRST